MYLMSLNFTLKMNPIINVLDTVHSDLCKGKSWLCSKYKNDVFVLAARKQEILRTAMLQT